MDKVSNVSLLLFDERDKKYERYISVVREWAKHRGVVLTPETGYRQAIERYSGIPEDSFDIVVGGIPFGESPFTLIDTLDRSKVPTVTLLLNAQANHLLFADPMRQNVTGSQLTIANVLKVLDSFIDEKQATVRLPVPTNVYIDVSTVSNIENRPDVITERTLFLIRKLSEERQLVFLGELGDDHTRATVIRDYLLDRIGSLVPDIATKAPSVALESIVRSVHADVAVLKYLEYDVELSLIAAVVDTTYGTIWIAEDGGEDPVLVSEEGKADLIRVNRSRTVPLQPGAALFLYTPRFFPTTAESDTLKKKLFRRLAQYSFSKTAIDATDNVSGTLIGIVPKNE